MFYNVRSDPYQYGTDSSIPCTSCRGTIYGYNFIGDDRTVIATCVCCKRTECFKHAGALTVREIRASHENAWQVLHGKLYR